MKLGQAPISAREARDRGYNLIVTAGLVAAGLAFGLAGFREGEVADKLDDFALIAVAVLGIGWYRFGRLRFSRSIFPLLLVVAAVASQGLGILIERDDATAVGDNFNALFVVVPLLAIALWEYARPLQIATEGTRAR